MKSKVAVLGASGMLGSMVVDYLSRVEDIELTALVRDEALLPGAKKALPHVNWQSGGTDHIGKTFSFQALRDQQWIINAIGIIKPLIHDDNGPEVERAIWVNSLLPHELARTARQSGARVLQIATDCVYSGRKGSYIESDIHDAEDVYGKTKSLGEVHDASTAQLRCSIIGPELRGHKSLLDWFTRQPSGSQVKGFINHNWNGVTTLHFAKICHGIIRSNLPLPHLQHVIPHGTISKARMLHAFASAFKRPDIKIEDIKAAVQIDRTLATSNEALNLELWQAAGYSTPPTVEHMIAELGAFERRLLI